MEQENRDAPARNKCENLFLRTCLKYWEMTTICSAWTGDRWFDYNASNPHKDL